VSLTDHDQPKSKVALIIEMKPSTYIRFLNIPPWSGLNHFELLSSTGKFADGTKFEDLSKVSHHAVLLINPIKLFTARLSEQ
jgi:hypothetical protein